MEAKRMFYELKYFFLFLIVSILVKNVNVKIIRDIKINVNSKESTSDYILCRLCGADLADAKQIINHLSPQATVLLNQTLFDQKGVEVQFLKNPLGIEFHAINLKKSKCSPVHNWQKDFSWYPGFAWKPCICSQCGAHHGWLFEPVEIANFSVYFPSTKRFFVLKLSNLLSENFANSLLIIPKSYL